MNEATKIGRTMEDAIGNGRTTEVGLEAAARNRTR